MIGSNISVPINITTSSASPVLVLAGRASQRVTLVGCHLVAGAPGNSNWPDAAESTLSFTDTTGNLLYGPVPIRNAVPFQMEQAQASEDAAGGWLSTATSAGLQLVFNGINLNGVIVARFDGG